MVQLLTSLNNADYKTPKNVLVVGVVHGDEPLGEDFIKNYLEIKNRTVFNNVYFIPRLNSSDFRKNQNGVDLNRNFPAKNWKLENKESDYFGGFEPASEIEIKYITALMEIIKFDAILTIHAPYKIINYDGPGLELAKAVSKILKYPIQKDIGYPTPGSFGTYAGIERNIPVITIEYDENATFNELYPKFKTLFSYFEKEF